MVRQKNTKPGAKPRRKPGRPKKKREESLVFNCTSCVQPQLLVQGKRNILAHPTLQVGICRECIIFSHADVTPRDEDGYEIYCTWCAELGNLICCDQCKAPICQECITRHVGKEYFNSLTDRDVWQCFSCDPSPIQHLRDITKAALDFQNFNEPSSLLFEKCTDVFTGDPDIDDSDREDIVKERLRLRRENYNKGIKAKKKFESESESESAISIGSEEEEEEEEEKENQKKKAPVKKKKLTLNRKKKTAKKGKETDEDEEEEREESEEEPHLMDESEEEPPILDDSEEEEVREKKASPKKKLTLKRKEKKKVVEEENDEEKDDANEEENEDSDGEGKEKGKKDAPKTRKESSGGSSQVSSGKEDEQMDLSSEEEEEEEEVKEGTPQKKATGKGTQKNAAKADVISESDDELLVASDQKLAKKLSSDESGPDSKSKQKTKTVPERKAPAELVNSDDEFLDADSDPESDDSNDRSLRRDKHEPAAKKRKR